MLPIVCSPLSDYFDDLPTNLLQDINYLDSEEAGAAWKIWGDHKARGLYDLPLDSWVLQVPWHCIGRWIDAYNRQDNSAVVPETIIKASGWALDQPLLLIQDSKNIIQVRLMDFSRCWDALLAAFDDGPLLVPAGSIFVSGSVFRFILLGNILQADISS